MSELPDDIMDRIFRPLCPDCGLIPKDKPAGHCYYCEMSEDWCQCDVADICKCAK